MIMIADIIIVVFDVTIIFIIIDIIPNTIRIITSNISNKIDNDVKAIAIIMVIEIKCQ